LLNISQVNVLNIFFLNKVFLYILLLLIDHV
jgi:hypothetical protein